MMRLSQTWVGGFGFRENTVFGLVRLFVQPKFFEYYVGLQLIKTRIPFDNGLFDSCLTFVEITLWNMNDNNIKLIKTNLYLLITLNHLL